MHARTVLSFLNLAAMTATFVVWLAFPQFAQYALYAALAWIVIAFTLIFSTWGSRPAGTRAAPVGMGSTAGGGSAIGSGSPLASAAPEIHFCIYCAEDLPVGADRCPTCGHAVRIR